MDGITWYFFYIFFNDIKGANRMIGSNHRIHGFDLLNK